MTDIREPIRNYMPKDTLCRKCVHALKNCTDVEYQAHVNIEGFNVIDKCNGFLSVEIEAANG